MADRSATYALLSKERVLRAAIALGGCGAASRHGACAGSAQELGVEAMSLYNHVANKDEILDGIVDLVVRRDRAALATGE